ncbi:SpaA isopeptide-forming pilin-related protein [Peptostreptococcus porci]|uniref:SpaA isopeptide-forming pilin-related protein n=1 Tax=Peptostreptococcus porci TaxID=2652282 RepID=UPI002A810C18|nr:SpaA isopeptide-forming pilin-related protein [Peptostreptococcus porci]MDY4128006.1 SpaA isopeptide-forming pilin-related protein [Peptostreptococcus porci]
MRKKQSNIYTYILMAFVLLLGECLSAFADTSNSSSSSSITNITNPDGTTTTITREESIFKYIFDPIIIKIPGVTKNYNQDGALKKKEVVVNDSTGETKIIWEYQTTIDGVGNYIKSIENNFMASESSGLGEPQIISIKKDGVELSDKAVSNFSTTDFKSATNKLPIQNGTYTYLIETPVKVPGNQYTLDYTSKVKYQATPGTTLISNGEKTMIRTNEIREIMTSGSLTQPIGNGDVLHNLKINTVNTSNDSRVNGRYRDSNDRVIEWTKSRLNTSTSNQNYEFDVAVDSSQSVHEHKVMIYQLGADGGYTLLSEKTYSQSQVTNNKITVDNVPPGAEVVVKTITNVANEKKNHTITGAELEALKGDLVINKNWATGTTPVEVLFTVNGGSFNNTKKTLPVGQTTITIPNVPKFEGSGSIATKKRFYYDVEEDIQSGYMLSSAEFDWENLKYTFNNKKDETKYTPPASGQYGITSIEPVNINYIKYQYGNQFWGGFSTHLKMAFKIPPYAREGDYFTLKIPEELKLDNNVSNNRMLEPVRDPNTGKIIANVYHTKDREIKFVLTENAYSVEEYDGWYVIGNNAGNIVEKNGVPFTGPYIVGVSPNLPKWYEGENPKSNTTNKNIFFETDYNGGRVSNKERKVETSGTLYATDSGRDVGELHFFDDIVKNEYLQEEDSIIWDLVINSGGKNLGNKSNIFWDLIHPYLELYNHNDNGSNIPQDIEFYIADATVAASYVNPRKMIFKGTSQNSGYTQYHYYLPREDGKEYGVAVFIKPENKSISDFGGYSWTHALEFYYENLSDKALVARIKTRKKIPLKEKEYYYNNMASLKQGLAKPKLVIRRAQDTAGMGGAYPTDWYSVKFKKIHTSNGVKRPLVGTIFTIYKDGNPYSTVHSDENGIVQFDNLFAGTYTFKEVEANSGYMLDPTVHTLTITNSQNITIDGKKYDENNIPEIDNKKLTSLRVNKYSQKDMNILKGAVFRLKSKGSDKYNVTVGENTDVNSFVFPNLNIGTYILEEISSPLGHKKISPIEIEVYEENGALKIRKISDQNNTLTSNLTEKNGSFSIDVVDEVKLAKFTVSKRIKGIENAGRFISGKMEFRLTKVGDDTFEPRKIRQNANENFTFELLPKGEYLLEEVNAPEGYVEDKNAIYKIIVDDDANIHFFKLSSANTNYVIADSSKSLIKHQLLSQHPNSSTDNNAIDGNLNTSSIWNNTDPNNTLGGNGTDNIRVGTYVGIDLGSAKLVSEVKFLQGQPSNNNDRMQEFSMEYSLDNANWQVYKRYNNDNSRQGDVSENDLAIYARYIRFVNNKEVLNKWFAIKEISAKTYNNVTNTITPSMQENTNSDNNIALVGNIQNPSLILEKVDTNKNPINDNNQGKEYNAKFNLYKISDNANTVTEEQINSLVPVQAFTLNRGRVELPQLADKLGRYALVEIEAPQGYTKVAPILLDLVETQQEHGGGVMKNTTAWKVVGNSTLVGNSNANTSGGLPVYTGSSETDKIFVDYSQLSSNKITLKVKNERNAKKVKLKIQKINKNGDPIVRRDFINSARLMITKDPDIATENGAYNGQIANLNSEDASFTFNNRNNNFESGLYYLRELRAPTGYKLLNKAIPFYIESSGNVIIPAKLKDGSTTEYVVDSNFSLADKVKIVNAVESDVVQIKLVNDEGTYPKTGGDGALKFVFVGGLLMVFAVIGLSRHKRYS